MSTKRSVRQTEISPDEILLDASNLPLFDQSSLQGRLERPIGRTSARTLAWLCVLVLSIALVRVGELQLVQGGEYAERSAANTLDHRVVFAPRGLIYDREARPLAWNVPYEEGSGYAAFAGRAYATTSGIGHVLGYVRLPRKDASGNYYSVQTEGVAGVELAYDTALRGTNGLKILEEDVRLEVVSEGVLQPPAAGAPLTLTIDAELQHALYQSIAELATRIPFAGGAGVIMDVQSGEIVALVSVPEYEPNAMLAGDHERISDYATDKSTPYLNRVLSGQYTPGSIVKPFFAVAALNEGIVGSETSFVSTGALRIANPYHPGMYTVFRDWRAHGVVDMRRALAVSSDVYFYTIGGGFGGQEGLGIARLESYARRFGFGAPTGIALLGEVPGVVPSPAWKAEVFGKDEPWRLGNTYHTAIGQYGFQVTPLQAVRATAALANGGQLLRPRITQTDAVLSKSVDIPDRFLRVARAGMRDAVSAGGTAGALYVPYVEVAAKTGTAELGAEKRYVNSWVTGFFPYEKPRYAFALLMERGPVTNLTGASYVMRQVLDWMHVSAPQYLEPVGE